MSSALLDLDVRTRREKVRFDLVDATGRKIGEVHPERKCTISNEGAAQIKRKLTGFTLTPSDTAAVNPLTDRVRPYWVLDDGSEYPLGVFLFAEASTARRSYGDRLTGTLVDQGLILAQEIDRTVGFDAGTSATSAITTVLEYAGFYGVSVAASTFELGSPVAWPAGQSGTTWAKVLDDLCAKAGAYPAHFDGDGAPVVRTIDNVAEATPVLDYRGRIRAGTIVDSNDLLIAPNRYLAVDTSATTGAIVGTFDIPDTAPHSANRRGFRITKVVEAPGVGDVAQAAAAAQAAYTSGPVAYATATWTTTPDPRAGTFDVVRLWDGENWLETAWTLPCVAGGAMTHMAKRVFL